MDIIAHSTLMPGIVGFGRYCISLPGLSYDVQSYLGPLTAAEIRP